MILLGLSAEFGESEKPRVKPKILRLVRKAFGLSALSEQNSPEEGRFHNWFINLILLATLHSPETIWWERSFVSCQKVPLLASWRTQLWSAGAAYTILLSNSSRTWLCWCSEIFTSPSAKWLGAAKLPSCIIDCHGRRWICVDGWYCGSNLID